MTYVRDNIEWSDRQSYINYRKEELEALKNYLDSINQDFHSVRAELDEINREYGRIKRLIGLKYKELEEIE